jgi:putative peptide zinc metalloprotease protein
VAESTVLPPERPAAHQAPVRPRRAAGLQLLGEFTGSGLNHPVFLVRRGDGQMIQLTELLQRIVEAADGTRSLDEIAARLRAECGRPVNAGNVEYLLASRLAPLGVIAADGGATPAPRATALLALAARRTLISAPAVRRIGGLFGVLFRPAVVAVVLAALAAVDVWLFARHSPRDGVREVLAEPGLILVLVGLMVTAALVHECGHAAACHYGGGRPGVIGFGMYLLWPAFYTDVTDAYRLGRTGRLRTDVGGVYFNGVFVLLLAGAFAVTRADLLVTVALLVHVDAARQLVPVVRLDGYHILGDLVGVPDLFGRLAPVLRTAVRRGRRGPADPRLAGLTRRAHVTITVWALVVVPLLIGNLLVILAFAPEVGARTAAAGWRQAGLTAGAVGDGKVLTALADAVSLVLLTLPAAGMGFVLVRLGRRGAVRAVVASRGRPGRAVAFGLAAAAAAGALVAVWVRLGV